MATLLAHRPRHHKGMRYVGTDRQIGNIHVRCQAADIRRMTEPKNAITLASRFLLLILIRVVNDNRIGISFLPDSPRHLLRAARYRCGPGDHPPVVLAILAGEMVVHYVINVGATVAGEVSIRLVVLVEERRIANCPDFVVAAQMRRRYCNAQPETRHARENGNAVPDLHAAFRSLFRSAANWPTHSRHDCPRSFFHSRVVGGYHSNSSGA